ncbi:Crp/Fnr family transcriptional regulator [Roseivivax halodurans JCM 10272]|uniref:Crp/Fnr family transcriptional regulator n=1 Tax=Roseivivax halodurans JCM 10272 TaxID=1449350 RepID=X7EGY2_9RHOB|nr:Crp/Fnr family transcriptional regulator [Roseivivax halodurans]ETX14358.1 Crp/Fnr family transcriptional regulator [Roseivivax halodurans JCM 10272]
MNTQTSELLSLVLGRRDQLDAEEQAALSALSVRTLRFGHNETIIPAGPTPDQSCLVVAGMALRVQPTHTEQGVVSAVHIPGDFVDLHALVLECLDHSVVAQGDCKVQLVDMTQLRQITEDFPHLTRLLWMLTLIDAKIHRAWLAAGATLRATERIAHFLCELYTRYDTIGFVQDGGFHMPLEQKDLERLFGLSRAHANRAVQELRARGLIDWTRGRVNVHDLQGLKEHGKFDPGYLEIARARR